jgi:hypothetical protein
MNMPEVIDFNRTFLAGSLCGITSIFSHRCLDLALNTGYGKEHAMATEANPYLRGIELFNARKFWEAHEAWEELWLEVDGIESDFYQGLIQSAAALLKFQRGELDPARRLYQLAKEKLDRCPAEYMRLNVREFQERMAASFAPILDGCAGDIDEAAIPVLALNPV